MPTILGLLLLFVVIGAGYYIYRRSQLRNDYSPMTTSGGRSSISPEVAKADNSGAFAGQSLVNETQTIPDGASYELRIPAGHYRIRATSDEEITAKWVGVACYASSGKVRSYEATCDPSSAVKLIIENPSRFGLGKSARVSVSIVTR